jgi:hypothetical protein
VKIKGLRWFVLTLVATVAVITAQSYVPFFGLWALLVPLAVLSVWILWGRIEPVSQK